MAKTVAAEATVTETSDIVEPSGPKVIEHIPEDRVSAIADDGRLISADPADARPTAALIVEPPVVVEPPDHGLVAVEEGSAYGAGHPRVPDEHGRTPYLVDDQVPLFPEMPLVALGQPRIVDPGDAQPVHPSVAGPNVPFVR